MRPSGVLPRPWQIIEDEFTGHLSDVAVSEGVAIAVGSEGTILRREDGPWQAAENGTDAELRAIWHDQKTGTWAAVGDRGTALLSHDGLTWTAEQTGTGQSLWGIFGDHSGRIIAVGTGGIILERTLQ